MKLVKLDEYSYDIVDVYEDLTILLIELDSTRDASYHDIASELSMTRRVFVDGRHFTCENYIMEAHSSQGGATLKLYLTPTNKGEAVNEKLPRSGTERQHEDKRIYGRGGFR